VCYVISVDTTLYVIYCGTGGASRIIRAASLIDQRYRSDDPTGTAGATIHFFHFILLKMGLKYSLIIFHYC